MGMQKECFVYKKDGLSEESYKKQRGMVIPDVIPARR